MRDLLKSLNELSDSAEFQVSWYLKDLASGATANRRGDVAVPSASTRKISIMMAALAAVHAGKLSLDQKVTIDARFQDNDSGTFQHLTPGFWITLRDAMVMMIIVSDNTCTGHVVDLVGLANVQRYTEAVGLTGTVHRYGIPPKTGADNTLDRVTRRSRPAWSARRRSAASASTSCPGRSSRPGSRRSCRSAPRSRTRPERATAATTTPGSSSRKSGRSAS